MAIGNYVTNFLSTVNCHYRYDVSNNKAICMSQDIVLVNNLFVKKIAMAIPVKIAVIFESTKRHLFYQHHHISVLPGSIILVVVFIIILIICFVILVIVLRHYLPPYWTIVVS